MQFAETNPLLSTKLYIPRARPGRVARARLIDRMKEAVGYPVTLVCAPAGYGKTTLLSEWIPHNEHCVTWLSLDAEDKDPIRFWRYFIAALQTLDPQLCKSPQLALEASQTPPLETALSLVINELTALDYRFSQVLDDYHLVESPEIDRSLTFLIEHLPPNVNLVITSRSDPTLPLARWRARQQLGEIRSADLRFNWEETAVFLNQAMQLELSAPEIAALEGRTEGWIAGLQLAALSLKDRHDKAGFINAFAGSHRFVIDYLVEEVLSQQAEPIREFLLTTSILDRLCAPLCNTLTGGSDGQAILERLEQTNLFLVPLDDQRSWYRYHHLFAEVLRVRLWQNQPELHARMHSRASAWFDAQGQIDDAIRHALAVPDIEQAACLVERNSLNMLQMSELFLIRTWLEQLPEEIIHSRPRLILAYGWVLVLTGRGEELDQWLEAPQSQAALTGPGLPVEILGELALLVATLARFRREAKRALGLAQQALDQLAGDDRGLQAGAMYTMGVAYLQEGEIALANQAFAEAVVLGETKGGPYMALIALQELSELQIKQGQLSQAIKTCQRAMDMARRWGWQSLPAAGLAHIYLGQVLYERDMLAEAGQALAEGVGLLLSSIEQFILAQGYILLAQVQQAGGDRVGAFTTLRQAKDWFTQMNVADTGAGVLLELGEVRLWIEDGNLHSAERWFQDCRWFPEETPLGYLQAVTLVRLRLAQNQRQSRASDLHDALEITNRLIAAAGTKAWQGQVIELALLRARLCQAQQDTNGMLSSLEQALDLAEPEGYVRVFVDHGEPLRALLETYQSLHRTQAGNGMDRASAQLLSYAERLLAAFYTPVPTSTAEPDGLLDPLTDREQEILQLLSDGYSNREIAARLVVAVSTVKSHINSLYSKLGTHRRTQAIAIARELGLL